MDRLGRIEAFIQVADEGSFSAAARSLRSSQPRLSKAIAELEQHLGARLLLRTTRTLSLTEAGTDYYEQVKPLMRLLEEADRAAVRGRTQVHGRLRVNTSAMLAGKLVVPALASFSRSFPEVDVEIVMDDRRIDPVEQATDVAVRVGKLSDSTLRVRRAGQAPVGVFAATAYLSGRGIAAEDVVDFAHHDVIAYAGQRPTVTEAGVIPGKSFTVSKRPAGI